MFDYTYTIASAFPSAKVDEAKLAAEIGASAITIALSHVSSDGVDCKAWFKAALPGGDQTILDALVAAHDGEPLPAPAQPVVVQSAAGKPQAFTADGLQRVAYEKPDTSTVTICSHDWTDPTTWAQDAERIGNEAPIRISSTKYRLLHENVIDSFHGKASDEDFLRDADGNSYRVAVTIDGVAKAEVDPHTNLGDFIVNYDSGMIYFSAAVDANADVRVTYHRARTSLFTLKPKPGTVLKLTMVECQFSADVDMRDSVTFQAWGYAGAFAPQLGLPPTTLIPLGDAKVYKSMSDFQNDSNRAYPAYAPLGGSSWRGMNQQISVFSWDYLGVKPLHASAGMEIRVKCAHDVPFGGYYATATFYCTSEPES